MARYHVREVLVGHQVEQDVVEDAELLVCEVVTNSVLYAKTPVTLETFVGADNVEVAITDTGAESLVVPRAGDSAGGHGMRLLDRIATDWRVEANGNGKTVRFRLSRTRHLGADLEAASPGWGEFGEVPWRQSQVAGSEIRNDIDPAD